MSIKEYLIKKIAVNKVTDKLISEKIIDTVISHQFDSALAATALHNSVEISGFGKFVFNQKRADKHMTKYSSQKDMYETQLENTELDEATRRNVEMRLTTLLSNIKTLKQKMI